MRWLSITSFGTVSRTATPLKAQDECDSVVKGAAHHITAHNRAWCWNAEGSGCRNRSGSENAHLSLLRVDEERVVLVLSGRA